eukprot:278994-Chlamydomonas_euryale.AAC.3
MSSLMTPGAWKCSCCSRTSRMNGNARSRPSTPTTDMSTGSSGWCGRSSLRTSRSNWCRLRAYRAASPACPGPVDPSVSPCTHSMPRSDAPRPSDSIARSAWPTRCSCSPSVSHVQHKLEPPTAIGTNPMRLLMPAVIRRFANGSAGPMLPRPAAACSALRLARSGMAGTHSAGRTSDVPKLPPSTLRCMTCTRSGDSKIVVAGGRNSGAERSCVSEPCTPVPCHSVPLPLSRAMFQLDLALFACARRRCLLSEL